jgi:hypothetical protein
VHLFDFCSILSLMMHGTMNVKNSKGYPSIHWVNFSSFIFLVLFSKQGNQWAQTLTYPKICTISCTACCPVPKPVAILVTRVFQSGCSVYRFFFVTLSSSSRKAIAGPIGDVYISFFTILDPWSDSTSADARVSIQTL